MSSYLYRCTDCGTHIEATTPGNVLLQECETPACTGTLKRRWVFGTNMEMLRKAH